MNKTELVNSIAEKTGITKIKAKNVTDAFIETVIESLKKGDKVTLVGFGTFSVVERSPRNGVNPRTGKKIYIPGKKVAKFKIGAELTKL
ncbi:HU family DNA-binding protein [Blattabacterium cuenoti]|uniref:HU family DNA-binding protein n=1 Tax=Blattabacterium cuenoti TaxID=1653831 RepID=UPI00163C161A|nr:HU family DNA-binding protein [Blattabacterium cuenoti]